MKLEWLEAFVAFAERMSFTHAARDLHISQPALHVQIARLADALGAPLYRRQGRALILTAEGRETLRFAREMRERAAELRDRVRTGASSPPARAPTCTCSAMASRRSRAAAPPRCAF